MADPEAVPEALRRELGAGAVRRAPRPGRSRAERTAKRRLADWTSQLLGARLLQGGREYAETIGGRVDAGRVGGSRNPDLKALLESRLAEFLRRCREVS